CTATPFEHIPGAAMNTPLRRRAVRAVGHFQSTRRSGTTVSPRKWVTLWSAFATEKRPAKLARMAALSLKRSTLSTLRPDEEAASNYHLRVKQSDQSITGESQRVRDWIAAQLWTDAIIVLARRM